MNYGEAVLSVFSLHRFRSPNQAILDDYEYLRTREIYRETDDAEPRLRGAAKSTVLYVERLERGEAEDTETA